MEPSAAGAGKRQGDGLSRNQFGGTFSGPVATDRLFFFGGYQGTRLRETPADLFAFVPTAAMLAGDFTQYAWPSATPPAPSTASTLCRQSPRPPRRSAPQR